MPVQGFRTLHLTGVWPGSRHILGTVHVRLDDLLSYWYATSVKQIVFFIYRSWFVRNANVLLTFTGAKSIFV